MYAYLLVVLSSLSFVIPFLNFNLFFFSWFSLVYVINLLEKKNQNPIHLGLLFGTFSTFFGLYWMTETIHRLSGAGLIPSFVIHLAYSLYESIFYIIIFYALKLTIAKKTRKFYRYGFIIFLYIVLEKFFPRVFPYKLGNTQILFNELSQLVSYFGLNILSIFVLLANITIYELVFKKNIRLFYIFLIFFVGMFFSGKLLISNYPEREIGPGTISVAVIQPDKDLDDLVNINSAIKENTFLTIWPESSLDRVDIFNKKDSLNFRKNFARKFQIKSKFILFGSIYQNKEGYHNAAILVDEKINIVSKYFKSKLMVFGEYYPFSAIISKIIPIYDSFVPLREGEIKPLLLNRENKIGVVICYEDLFEENSILLSQRGSKILINITNDEWYGDSLASYQHLMLAIPRAIENRKYLIRSAKTGISAIINPNGLIVKQIDMNKKGFLNERVELLEEKSFYTKYHGLINWFYYIILVFFLGTFFYKLRKSGH